MTMTSKDISGDLVIHVLLLSHKRRGKRLVSYEGEIFYNTMTSNEYFWIFLYQ